MSDASTTTSGTTGHGAEHTAGHAGHTEHTAGHAGHEHEGPEPLGPIDPIAWGAGALGVVLGLIIAACFALATGAI